MSWEDILKAGLSAIHFRNLRKAVAELSNTYSDLLENPSTYKKEIIELAITNFVEETGERSKGLIFKYNHKWNSVIARVVNSIKEERDIE